MDDATATLRGLTTGAGTSYRWASWPQGLLGTADVRALDQFRPRRNGVTPGDDFLGGRTIAFEVVIPATSRAVAEAALSDLAAAFAPAAADEWLDVRIAGDPAEYALRGRARGCQVSLARRFVSGVIDARCVFVATDPVRYGPEQSVSIALAVGGGSMLPFVLPVVLGAGGSSGVELAANAGSTAVDWTATLTGPLTNPRLEHVEAGRFVRVAATLAAGETLVLDSSSGGLLLGGTTPRPTWFGSGSRWFQLQPGANSLRLTADAGSGSVNVVWRSGWA